MSQTERTRRWRNIKHAKMDEPAHHGLNDDNRDRDVDQKVEEPHEWVHGEAVPEFRLTL